MVPDVSFLPELSDFLLVGVARYYGVLAAVLLSGLLLFLLLRFLRLSLRQRNQLGMLMGTGCAAVFLIEAVFYFMNNCRRHVSGKLLPVFLLWWKRGDRYVFTSGDHAQYLQVSEYCAGAKNRRFPVWDPAAG